MGLPLRWIMDSVAGQSVSTSLMYPTLTSIWVARGVEPTRASV
jgi:hypothetical protein